MATAHDVIGAIRLAMEAAGNEESRSVLIERLLTYAPQTEGSDTEPVKLLVQAMHDSEASLVVQGT